MHLPIGVSDFETLITYNNSITNKGYLYVDKTLFIKTIIEDGTPVIVITRPRRFGKTLNLSMLNYFWSKEINQKTINKNLFSDLNVSKHPTCMTELGKYPVVFITFKDIKEPNIHLCLDNFRSVMAFVYRQHRTIFASMDLSKDDLIYIENILAKTATRIDLQDSIQRLLELLNKHYKEKPILLIDEYDTPLQEAYLNSYYEELITFLKNFLSKPLKDCNALNRAILTGILRISKESLFSDLNNVEVCSILHKKYSNYFGFTEKEVNELLNKTNLSVNFKNTQDTKEWYNGYKFGGTTIYNPWSIIKFINEQGKVAPYWINTSSNKLIKNLLINSSIETQDKIGTLIAGGTITEVIDENIVFKDLDVNRSAIWSLFLMSGYLNALSSEFTEYGNLCNLKIPNKEIEFLYKQIFRERLYGNRGITWYQELLTSLTTGKIDDFEIKLQQYIEFMASYHDTSKTTQEIFYHGLMLGILAGLKDTYEIKSNRESGFGRYDLIIIPKNSKELGIIMEFKAINIDVCDENKLINTATEALNQIKQSKYTNELIARGINNICPIGIAFSGKNIKVVS